MTDPYPDRFWSTLCSFQHVWTFLFALNSMVVVGLVIVLLMIDWSVDSMTFGISLLTGGFAVIVLLGTGAVLSTCARRDL